MPWLLAQLERDEALARGYWNLSMIALVGLLGVVFFLAMFMIRRWKRRQLKAIEKERAQRRASKTGERVDAWAASAERYVDHDKLPAEEDRLERDGSQDDDEADPPDDEDDRDPYGLFDDKPYRDAEDDDDFDKDDGEAWRYDEDDDEDEEEDEDDHR